MTKDWRLYALVALAGFALVGVTQTASCGFKDLAFLHDQRVQYERLIEAQAQRKAQQAAQPTPPAAPKPAAPAPTPVP